MEREGWMLLDEGSRLTRTIQCWNTCSGGRKQSVQAKWCISLLVSNYCWCQWKPTARHQRMFPSACWCPVISSRRQTAPAPFASLCQCGPTNSKWSHKWPQCSITHPPCSLGRPYPAGLHTVCLEGSTKQPPPCSSLPASREQTPSKSSGLIAAIRLIGSTSVLASSRLKSHDDFISYWWSFVLNNLLRICAVEKEGVINSLAICSPP